MSFPLSTRDCLERIDAMAESTPAVIEALEALDHELGLLGTSLPEIQAAAARLRRLDELLAKIAPHLRGAGTNPTPPAAAPKRLVAAHSRPEAMRAPARVAPPRAQSLPASTEPPPPPKRNPLAALSFPAPFPPPAPEPAPAPKVTPGDAPQPAGTCTLAQFAAEMCVGKERLYQIRVAAGPRAPDAIGRHGMQPLYCAKAVAAFVAEFKPKTRARRSQAEKDTA